MPRIAKNHPLRRYLLRVFCVAVALVLLVGALSLPFVFESQTIRYQFGPARGLLLAGQVMGAGAGVLLLFQLILSSRIKFLDRIFSINRLMSRHRIHGIIIAAFALIHVLLIRTTLGPEILSLSLRQWPEYIGCLVLVMILGAVAFSLLRQAMGLAYEKWLFLHRFAAPVTACLLGVHVFFVSDTFQHGPARHIVPAAFTAYGLVYVWIRVRNLWVRRHTFRVATVSAAGKGSFRVELRPEKGGKLRYRPGQFAFLRFKSDQIPGEEHPFTLSSTPTRPPMLEFTIRACGDWTRKIEDLRVMDRAFVQGPFGLYGHLNPESASEMVMIAGGIGITPMLSILRYLADTKDRRAVLLIWSNQTQEQVVYPDEFRDLENDLPGLKIVHVRAREPEFAGEKGRLEKARLERLLTGRSRDVTVLVCGPPEMMRAVRGALMDLGFPRGSIYMERFAL